MKSLSRQRHHCDAFLAANADKGVHKPPHVFVELPAAAGGTPPDQAITRRLTASFATPRSSFDVWAALARLDVLLSDFRRLAPSFTFEQLTGEESVATGNEYRLSVTDSALLHRLEAACTTLAGEDRGGALGGRRCMDVRVVRAGPWGGETGELVVEALINHAMAGTGSLWVLVHGDEPEGLIRVRLDAFEIARWAWEPDRRAAGDREGDGILDWPYLFERLAESIDAQTGTSETEDSFTLAAPPSVLAQDPRVRDALSLHPALGGLVKPVF